MERRHFVRRLPVLTGGIAAAGASLSLASCAGAPYLRALPSPPGTLAVSALDLGDGGAFVRAPGFAPPLFLSRGADGAPAAVLASCTHRGCVPEPLGERLACPCHGSEFAFDGTLLQGPAERPLARFPAREDGGEIVVRLQAVGNR